MEIQEEPIFFCLLDYFYGQKRPQNAINEVYPAISPPGVSKLVVLRGSRLDLSRKHPGRCVIDIILNAMEEVIGNDSMTTYQAFIKDTISLREMDNIDLPSVILSAVLQNYTPP